MIKEKKTESIFRTLLTFSLPLILSGVLQQLYNWVDAFIVGNVDGELELAAIGSTVTVSGLLLMAITGFTLGISVFVAQKYGSGEEEEINKVLGSFSILLGLIFTVLSCLGMAFAGRLLSTMHTTPETIWFAKDYLQIIFAGIPFLAVYNVYAAVLRGIGDSRSPFLSIVFSTGLNTILDILFIAVWGWGVRGAAVATVMSQICMTLFLVWYAARKHSILRFRVRGDLFTSERIRTGFGFGMPPMLQSSVNALGNVLLQNFMNGFGTQTVTAITTAYRIDTILLLPIINLGAGISTLVAQSHGAKEEARTVRVVAVGAGMMTVASLALTALILLSGGFLLSLFGIGPETAAIGEQFFQRIAWCYLIFGIATVFRSYLEGMGHLVFSSAVGMTGLAVRILLSYALGEKLGNMIIAYAEAFAWVVMLVMYTVRGVRRMREE